ncbi:MAG TPA: chemotaxis protein CheD [Candidatus Hydrogenedentes bacterium]|nr:chemotaxis protein CheD [Candidatus Hydrogenedentota bacterium]
MKRELGVRQKYLLEPGYMCCLKRPGTLHAVVGSCVVVCLWDMRLRYGGMNHFLFPATRDPAQATPRYGNVATLGLIRMMEEAGCRRQDLVAQILGGASPRNRPENTLGQRNVSAAREILQRKGIHIGSEDVGGFMGRKIAFDTATGHVMVLKVFQIRETDWIEEDNHRDSARRA